MSLGRPAKRLRWALVLVGVVAVCLVGYSGHQALKAKDALEVVAADFENLAAQMTDGDGAGARQSLESAQAAAEEARINTRGPGWWLTSRLPGVGDDVTAIRTVADVVDVLAAEVLPPIVVASEKLKPSKLRPVNGRVRLGGISRAAPSVVQADLELQEQAARVAALEPGGLNDQLASPVIQLQDKLGEAASLSERVSLAVRLLPSLMGADGKRTYLLLFQNNAEVRATGGIPGAFAIVTADNGRIEMGAQAGAAEIGQFDPPLSLTREEVRVFDSTMGIFPQDVNFTPEFPRSAELIRGMWEQARGQKVDGVLSTDPVALSYLLDGTGPIALPTGEQLTPANAVKLLLSGIYLTEPDPALQNVFFATAARDIFDAISSGQGDPRAVLDGVALAGGEGRLLLWSADKSEQKLIAPTRLGGDLPAGGTSHPQVGVYYNDATGAKMQYYLRDDVSVESTGCQEGRQDLRVTVEMRSTAPANAAELPVSVIGSGAAAPRGSFNTTVLVYLPVGAKLGEALIDDEESFVEELEHVGRPVVATTVELAPGQTRTLTYDVVGGGADQQGAPELRVTPGVHGTGIGDVSGSSC